MMKNLQNNISGNDIQFLMNDLFNAVTLSCQSNNIKGKKHLNDRLITQLDKLIKCQAKKLSNEGINVQFKTSNEIKNTIDNHFPDFILTLIRDGKYSDAEEILNTNPIKINSFKKEKLFYEEIMKASLPYPEGRDEFLSMLKERIFTVVDDKLSDKPQYIAHDQVYSDAERSRVKKEHVSQEGILFDKLIKEAEDTATQFFDPILKAEYEKTILPKIRELKEIFIPPTPNPF